MPKLNSILVLKNHTSLFKSQGDCIQINNHSYKLHVFVNSSERLSLLGITKLYGQIKHTWVPPSSDTTLVDGVLSIDDSLWLYVACKCSKSRNFICMLTSCSNPLGDKDFYIPDKDNIKCKNTYNVPLHKIDISFLLSLEIPYQLG